MPRTKTPAPKSAPSEQPVTPQALFDPAPPAPPVAERTPVETAPPPAPEAEPPATETKSEGDTSATVEPIRLGQAEGLLHRMPLTDVLVHLDAFRDRIALLEGAKAVLDLQPRMRATEGRCAPIYFVDDLFGLDDDDDAERGAFHLLHGIEAVTAAITLGLETVSVVTLAPGDAETVQSYLAGQAGTGSTTPEDDLVMQVNAHLNRS